jgi:hypothetical protein
VLECGQKFCVLCLQRMVNENTSIEGLTCFCGWELHDSIHLIYGIVDARSRLVLKCSVPWFARQKNAVKTDSKDILACVHSSVGSGLETQLFEVLTRLARRAKMTGRTVGVVARPIQHRCTHCGKYLRHRQLASTDV